MATPTKAIATGLVLALLTVLATVSCGPGIAFLASLAGNQQCTSDGGLATGGEVVPVPSGNPDAKLAFRAASWNVLKSNSVTNVADGLNQLAGTADVVGLQEFREKFRGATIKNAVPGWAWSNQSTSVPITWNATKFDLVAKDRVQEFGVTRVAGGPVGRSAGPKFAEWVQLRDRRTGATFVMVNHHLLYNIESKGHPDKRVGKRYLGLAQKQMRVEQQLVDRFTALGLPVVVTKDGNWDYRKSARTKSSGSPYVQAARHGLYTNWQVLGAPKQGTQSSGTRLIDSVSATTALLIPVQQTILGQPKRRWRGSDHRSVVVALTNSGSSINASLTKAKQVATAQKAFSVQSSTGGYSDPVSPAVIGARFGATGSWARYHTGLDYRAAQGQPIRAVTAGRVVYAGNQGDWAGNHVAVEHASGHTTMYSHMSRIDVTEGQAVQAGTQLGLVGQTGRAFGAHLHFELYPPGVRPGDVYKAVDPHPWLNNLRGTGGAAEGLTAGGGPPSLPRQGRWTGEQRSIAAAFKLVWQSRRLPDRALEIIMITGLVESDMSSPDEERSDLDSAGPLQQRRDYGTEKQRRDPVHAAGRFFDRMVTIRDWQTRPQGDVAQAVQISRYPDRYQKRLADARDLIASVAAVLTDGAPQPESGICGDAGAPTSTYSDTATVGRRTVTDPTSGITYEIPIPDGPAGVAMNFALDQLGEPYEFGSQGPDTWDCSGLVSKAWKAAGVDVYPQTEQLVKDLSAVTTPQPGDLLYKPGHVQMYLMKLPSGKQLVVEAPRTGKNVQVVPQWMNVTRTLRPGR